VYQALYLCEMMEATFTECLKGWQLLKGAHIRPF